MCGFRAGLALGLPAVSGIDFKRYAPLILLGFLVVVPLAIWAATSGGSGSNKDKTFIAERSVGLTGAPELLLTINDPSVEVTNSRTTVDIECEDAKGNVIVKGTQPWPFPPEVGYAPHAHQAASSQEVEQARRCRVIGTNKKLEAPVQ